MNMHKRLVSQAGFLLLAMFSVAAWAAGAGTVTHLSGTLSVQRPDGSWFSGKAVIRFDLGERYGASEFFHRSDVHDVGLVRGVLRVGIGIARC